LKCNELRPRIAQDRLPVADQPARAEGVRRGPRLDHRGRGEALADRGAGARGALRHRQPADCIGKKDEQGNWLFPVKGALDPNDVAICIGERLLKTSPTRDSRPRRAAEGGAARLAETQDVAVRIPYFCSGCPHNSSTVVPEGMRAYAGIGCHYMAQWMDRSTLGFTQMGGEGANWIGEAPFSKTPDTCSRIWATAPTITRAAMAIRAAIASASTSPTRSCSQRRGAMTGGQELRGLTVPQIAARSRREGARRVVVVSDEPEISIGTDGRASPSTPRRAAAVQRAAKSRLHGADLRPDLRGREASPRKRGSVPDPEKRVDHQRAGLRGCGDCGVNRTAFGAAAGDRVRAASAPSTSRACNKDYSCVKGFCPSFVTVHGATLKKGRGVAEDHEVMALPEPSSPKHRPDLQHIIVTGVGGTGIVTIGGILGMAAHLEGKGVGVIDMAGLAQKGGAVYSHMRIAERPEDIHAIRVAAGGADLVLGGRHRRRLATRRCWRR
jgi:indolepyruvate ferredoxin oxidoreductase